MDINLRIVIAKPILVCASSCIFDIMLMGLFKLFSKQCAFSLILMGETYALVFSNIKDRYSILIISSSSNDYRINF